MSHSALALFPCNPGKGEEFLGILMPALADTRAFEGCESIETYVDQDNPDHVYIWEKWASRENYEAYLAWRLESGMLDLLTPFMAPAAFRAIHLGPKD